MADVFLVVTMIIYGIALVGSEAFLYKWLCKRFAVGSGPTADNRELGAMGRGQEADFAANCGATYHVPGERRPKKPQTSPPDSGKEPSDTNKSNKDDNDEKHKSDKTN